MSRRLLLAGVLVVVLVAAGLWWAGRGGEGGGRPGPGGGGAVDPALAQQGEALAGRLFAGLDTAEAARATAQGTVATYDGDRTAVAEVLAVEADADSVVLRWRVTSPAGVLRVRPNAFDAGRGVDTSGVVLVDPAVGVVAHPFRFTAKYRTRCVCSEVPKEVGAGGQVLTGLYPPLAPKTTTVEVRVPGFPPLAGVTVDWKD